MAVIDAFAVVPHARAAVSTWLQRAEYAPEVVPDPELVQAAEHRLLSWRSRSQRSCSAVMHLSDAPGGCTAVRLVLSAPEVTEAARPRIAREIAALDRRLNADLLRPLQADRPADRVQEASEDSFPASDAPSWTPTKGAATT